MDSTVLANKLSNDHHSTNSGDKGKDRPICTHYGKTGHTVDKCYKLHGFPPGFMFKNKSFMAHQVSSEFLPLASPMHHQNSALHLNSVNSFLPCLVLQVHLLQYHLKSKKLPWPMQLLLPLLPVCQCQVLIFPTCFLCTSDQ